MGVAVWKSPWTRWGIVLGFALGGIFNLILLHQILHWHFLLSSVPGLSDICFRVLWAGFDHVLMFLIALVGLFGLWRAHMRAHKGWEPLHSQLHKAHRRAHIRAHEGWGRGVMFGSLLIGFGLWHVVDSVVSRWMLGIHRIEIDSPNPLAWDLIWLFVFGVIPLFSGWLLVRGGRRMYKLHRSTAALLMLTATTTGAWMWSAWPAPDLTTVGFRSDVSPQQMLAAVESLDARIVWTDPSTGLVVVAPDRRRELYSKGAGALSVTGSNLLPPAACFNPSRY